MVMDQWEVCCLLGCWELLMKDRPSCFFSILFHVVLPSRPSTVLQTLLCRQVFQKPALSSFSPSPSDHLAVALVEKLGGVGLFKGGNGL